MLFGYDKNMMTPKNQLPAVYVYNSGNSTVVNKVQKTIAVERYLQKDGFYLANKVTKYGKIGFGISAVDYNVSFNKNGVYKVQALNGSPILDISLIRIS
jgi:hypothetical protein